VTVVHGDLRDLDLSDATVVVMYLLPDAVAGLAESHLLPLLRRGRPKRSAEQAVTGDDDDGSVSREGQEGRGGDAAAGEDPVLEFGSVQEVVRGGEGRDVLEGRRSSGSGGGGGGGGGGGMKPCRIVCNTWGIPGATAVREAGVGLHGGVKLRLFTHESLPDAAGYR